MSQIILVLAVFILALAIGFYLGKLLSKTQAQAEKSSLEERVSGLVNQMEQVKNQLQAEKLQFEKTLAQVVSEKENLQKEKEALAIHLAKKENDFDNLLERNKEQKQEVNELQEKFTKEFENLANKILELRNDEALREKIAEGGHQLFQERATPKVIVGDLVEKLNELVLVESHSNGLGLGS